MTDQQTAAEPEVKAITWRGREIAVRFPTDGQLLVWQRSIKDIQAQDTAAWDGEQALKALSRLGLILDSVMVDRPDREWLDDLTLEEGLGLMDRAEILRLAVEAFGVKTEDETEAPKKVAPAKRARRKAS